MGEPLFGSGPSTTEYAYNVGIEREVERQVNKGTELGEKKILQRKHFILCWICIHHYPPLNSRIAAIVKLQLSVLIYNVTDGCETATGTCDQDDYIKETVELFGIFVHLIPLLLPGS